MSHRFVIPLRVPGLVLADFALRLYRDGSRAASEEAGITVEQLTDAGDYAVDGCPDGAGASIYTLTGQTLGGAGFSHVWPQRAGTPAAVVIPLRDAGAVAGDFGLKLYRNGVEMPLSLTVVELGDVEEPGDYRATGWSCANPGEEWLLTWELAGQTFGCAWTGGASASGTVASGRAGRRFRRLIDRAVRRFGEGLTITLRRRHSLIDDSDGAPSTLELVGDHAEGAMAVTLAATRLDGRMVPGIQLVVAGGTYEAAREATAGSNRVIVQLTAPLEAAAADGDDVTLQPYRDYTFAAMVGSRSEAVAGLERSATQTIVLSAEGAPTVPRVDDLVQLDGWTGDAIQVQPIQPGGTACGWRLQRTEKAA